MQMAGHSSRYLRRGESDHQHGRKNLNEFTERRDLFTKSGVGDAFFSFLF